MIFLTPGEPSGAMFMPAQQNVAKKLRKSNKTWRFGSNTNLADVSLRFGVTKIMHDTPNERQWVDVFDLNQFGSAIIIMGTQTNGAMFIVTKRSNLECYIHEVYNTGNYQCYKAPTEYTDRITLAMGPSNGGTYFTRDIIIMGSVYQ